MHALNVIIMEYGTGICWYLLKVIGQI